MLTQNDVLFMSMTLWEVIEENRRRSDAGVPGHGDFCLESSKAFTIRSKLSEMYPTLPRNDNERNVDALLQDLQEGRVTQQQVKATLLSLKVLKLD